MSTPKKIIITLMDDTFKVDTEGGTVMQDELYLVCVSIIQHLEESVEDKFVYSGTSMVQ